MIPNINKKINRIIVFLSSKPNFTVLLFLFIATIVFFLPLFLHPNEMMYPAYDITEVFYYDKLFFVKSIINYHQIPLWNPFIFSGTPFLVNPQTAVFYPTTLLFLLFPTYSLFGFLFSLDIFLAGIFTFIYCKSIRLSTFAAILSSISFMFSGALITLFIPGHLVVLDPVIWFPVSLTLTGRIINKQTFSNISFLAIVTALIILGGHIQLSFYLLAIVSMYLLFMLVTNYINNKNFKLLFKTFLCFCISILLGMGISSIQLLSAFEFASLSDRAAGVTFEFASSFSIHPYQFISVVLPHFFGDNLVFWGKANFSASSIYIGVSSLFFIFFSFLKKNKYVIFFSILAFFTFLYATGEHMPLFPLLYSLFTKFNSFRVPSRALYFFVFALSVISGFGIQNFLDGKLLGINRLKKISAGLIATTVAIFTLTLFLYNNHNSINLYESFVLRNSFAGGMNHLYIFNLLKNDLLTFCLILISLTLIVLSFIFKKIDINTFKILIIFLSLSDLFIFGQILIQTQSPKEVFKIDEKRQIILQDKSLYRVFDMEGATQGLQNNIIPNITGVNSLYLKSFQNFIYKIGPHFNQDFESFFLFSNIYDTEILKLLNVKYVIAHKVINNRGLRLILSDKGSFLYELTNTYPRVYFSNTKDKEGYYIPEQRDNDVRIISYTPNKIELYVDVKKSERLILSEIYFPGWKAYIDSKEIQVENVNGIFRSIKLNSGRYKIKFVYDPLSFKLGVLMSGLTVALIIIVFLISKRQSN